MTTDSPILIVGGGIGGLVLANALQNRSIPFRIFERDPSLGHRTQGYRFHLPTFGGEAMFACLSEKVKNRVIQCSPKSYNMKDMASAQLLNATTGEPMDMTGLGPPQHSAGSPLNIDRSTLRMALSADLPVEFGKGFSSFETHEDGVTVHFSDGSAATGSLLVGCDGLRSKVRAQLLPDYQILDTEGRWIWGKSDLTPELRSKLSPKKMDWGVTGFRDLSSKDYPRMILTEAIIFDRSESNPYRDAMPADYIYWVLPSAKKILNVEDDAFLDTTGEKAIELGKKVASHMVPEFRAMIEHCNRDNIAAQLVTCGDPEVPAYNGSGRVVLMGDAIHPMPPTAGLGATSAIQDAKWLAEALEEAGGKVTEAALQKYEAQMRENGKKAIASSEPRSKMMFGAPGFDGMKRLTP